MKNYQKTQLHKLGQSRKKKVGLGEFLQSWS